MPAEPPANQAPLAEFFQGKDGDWYWRILASNGNELARSSEGYKNRSDAERSYQLSLQAPDFGENDPGGE